MTLSHIWYYGAGIVTAMFWLQPGRDRSLDDWKFYVVSALFHLAAWPVIAMVLAYDWYTEKLRRIS